MSRIIDCFYQVGNPQLSTELSDVLIREHGHYVQVKRRL